MIFETHAHLDFFANSDDNSVFYRICESCIENNISKIVVPPISFDSNFVIADLLKGYEENIFQAIGLHPKEAINTILTNKKQEELLDLYREKQNIVAIKTGLDFSKTKLQEAQIKHQIDSFRRLTIMAAELNLGLILHIRDAWSQFLIEWEAIIKKLDDMNLKTPKTVIHCYNGRNLKETEEVINKGINFFGVGGKIFTDVSLRNTIKDLSLKCIVLETDSPYLQPEAYIPPDFISEYKKNSHRKLKGMICTQNPGHIFMN
ncbi:TatD family hydrolase [Eubacterium sp.]|uniref:TatD family hydrolase n=1 Tax=Eubacterium sp. TaxID=142586 RepID=UPI00399559E2